MKNWRRCNFYIFNGIKTDFLETVIESDLQVAGDITNNLNS